MAGARAVALEAAHQGRPRAERLRARCQLPGPAVQRGGGATLCRHRAGGASPAPRAPGTSSLT
eukprot:813126-Prymnesium_polylepis.1